MSNKTEIEVIAHIYNDYTEKFGIPRQSGIVDSVISTIIFKPSYRIKDAFRGLEGFSHIWLIWSFSEIHDKKFSPTVRPPKLGGNKRAGVFATRSPFRPNSLGLSSVKLEKIEYDPNLGPVLFVSGADLMNGTPIFDIKPYLPFTDCRNDATGGFSPQSTEGVLEIKCDKKLTEKIPREKLKSLFDILSHDPRPAYQNDKHRIYGLNFSNYNIKFTVDENILEITDITEITPQDF